MVITPIPILGGAMGLYRKKNSDIWWVDLYISGKRIRKSCKTNDEFLAKEIMERMRQWKWENQVLPIKPTNHPTMSLKVAIELTLKDYFWKLPSYKVVEYTLTKTCRILGPKIQVEKISEDTYIYLKMSLKNDGLTDCTIKKYFSTLNRVLKHVKRHYKVPCFEGFNDDTLVASPYRVRTISDLEERAIREWFSQANKLREKWDNTDLLEILDVLFATGMRRGECFNFTVAQIRRDYIEFGPNQHKTGRHTGTKSVCLNETARRVINGRIDRLQMKPGQKVFPYSSVAFTRLWGHMRRDLGLAHDTGFLVSAIRHTFASRLLEKGASLYDISKLLGHTNLMTTAIYAHMSTGHLTKIACLLD